MNYKFFCEVDICWSTGDFEKDFVHGSEPMGLAGYTTQMSSLDRILKYYQK